MSETPSKREQQRQVRRQQILDAALAVFSEKGFHGANVSDVAAAAGVSQGTIYWYFDSKEELLTAAVMNFFVGFGEEAMTGLAMGESPTEMLHAMERSMVGFVHEAEGLFALFL
ncbi:MAG: helix-turn-helix domain-containing protein, partial [Anaerolineae bacterium]